MQTLVMFQIKAIGNIFRVRLLCNSNDIDKEGANGIMMSKIVLCNKRRKKMILAIIIEYIVLMTSTRV